MSAHSALNFITGGFGLERIGLVSLRYPKLTLTLLALATVFMSICALNLQFESDTRGLFRSKSSEYAKFEEITKLYPGQLNRVLLVVEGNGLHTAAGLEALRSLHLELEFVDEIENVTSLFSARHAPTTTEDKGSQFVPDPIEPSQDMAQLEAAIKEHPIVKNKLISNDGETALLIALLNSETQNLADTSTAIEKIKAAATQALEGTDLTFAATGLPVIRAQVIQSLLRDQIIFIVAGVSIGIFFSMLFFRDIRYVILTELPVTVAISGLLGGMWLTGQKVNLLSGMVTPLISVISLAAALHMAFAIRRALQNTSDLKDAIRTAIIETGPGCVLSALTTALALLALTFAPYPFIHNFGLVAVTGALFALFATLLTIPAAAFLILKTWPSPSAGSNTHGTFSKIVDAICQAASVAATSHRRLLAITGVISVIVMGAAYMQNKPSYTSSENLPATSLAVQTIGHIDKNLAGSSNVRILLRWPDGEDFPNAQGLKAVAEAHQILADQNWMRTVWSLQDVVNWAQRLGRTQDETLKIVKNIQDNLTGQVITLNPNSALITGYFPDTDARTLVPRLETIEKRLVEFNEKWPNAKATLSGVSTLEAVTGTKMINTLNWGLLSAIALIILLIALALRSLRAGLVSVVPNLFPIAVGGTYLYLLDKGLQFTSVVAFTIGFGMAVDSTIHYLNHYNLARRQGLTADEAIKKTTTNVGPVLVVTTVLVAAGLGATLLSDLPLVNLYGKVSILVLVAALAADLLILPAIIAIVDTQKSES